jgi:hypothetical protein
LEVKLLHAPSDSVIVPPLPKPELEFIKTSSDEVGKDAPPEPPDVADQWLV